VADGGPFPGKETGKKVGVSRGQEKTNDSVERSPMGVAAIKRRGRQSPQKSIHIGGGVKRKEKPETKTTKGWRTKGLTIRPEIRPKVVENRVTLV